MNMTKGIRIIFCTLAAIVMQMLVGQSALAQAQHSSDSFVPIAKYISRGDARSLSSWFAKNLEINILGKVNDCSKRQATQIVRNFFTTYKVKSFTIIHKSGVAPMKYAIGILNAGGQSFRVTLFVRTNEDGNYIQQFTIERE